MTSDNNSSDPNKKKLLPENWDIDFKPLHQFMDRMDSLFNHSFKQINGHVFHPFFVETVETDQAMIIKAELPGYTREQIELELIGNRIKIVAESSISDELQSDSFSKKESSIEKKERIITIPFNIPKKETTANLENGILIITVPKLNTNRHYLDIE
ncbi:class I heat shock protein (low molecular weight) [Oceanobacillus iheyensis HTE831]|uniref:Class I heat shock protein (Low molecular weight) n=1 Tax=Oceanobacillus iheyensis (strain DSM 14371 / CIP 107618 / JCM 11309 / KCTC 3954 / HTE831) TaxID=221109 RepID=Q8EMZ6_OCEIH|nr:Hsp20/alpha crystallin family protein [Oceanobacillus iheyensis]BAC14650.1 class I heat shock protein (low molecular weight) [Oceanobacillus iheyensis HTE831]